MGTLRQSIALIFVQTGANQNEASINDTLHSLHIYILLSSKFSNLINSSRSIELCKRGLGTQAVDFVWQEALKLRGLATFVAGGLFGFVEEAEGGHWSAPL